MKITVIEYDGKIFDLKIKTTYSEKTVRYYSAKELQECMAELGISKIDEYKKEVDIK